MRRPPRITGIADGAPVAGEGADATATARELVTRLDATTFPIQGPPGTGKTWTAARMILDLVAAGRRVGVTAQSHRVIENLLEAVVHAARDDGRTLRIAQRVDADDDVDTTSGIERIPDTKLVPGGLAAGRWDVVGGTTWVWARADLEGLVDVLFVDEAGQMSLANVCSVAGAATSIVLLGDPNQLPQVSQGTHPEGASASALEHLVGDAKTISPDRGLLLGTTYRLHPDVNAFVSDAFYEGRLATAPGTARQQLGPGRPVGGTGIRFVPLVHHGSSSRSRTEADWVAAAIEALVGRPWVDDRGRERRLAAPDVLVVAPYNAQVAEIDRAVKDRLGVHANVGTVDKFQGREAPVAIYSLATSTPDDAPRDLEFLYSGNRLNVAVSRARGLAVVVASPELLRVSCHTPEQMRLVNAFCRLVEIAAAQAADDTTRDPAPPEPLAVVVDATHGGADLLLFPELGASGRRRGDR